MSGSLIMAIVVGIFVLIVVVLGIVLLVGRMRPAKHEILPPETVPHPGAQAIPPTGSR
jgi:flagellar basal body-associated protein FliL